MSAKSERRTLRQVAIGASLVGIFFSMPPTLIAIADGDPRGAFISMLLFGTPWFLGLVPVIAEVYCWLMRTIWAAVVAWGGVLAWLTLAGGLGFIILPLTLLYAGLLAATWMIPRSDDGGICR